MSSSFPATLAELPAILSWVRFHLDQTSLSKFEKMPLELAMEEAVVNVIRHSETDELTLTVRHVPGRQIEFDLSDSGPPFNPLKNLPPEDKALPLEEQELGGKGLLLMRKCTDALLYRREDNCNIITLIKNI